MYIRTFKYIHLLLWFLVVWDGVENFYARANDSSPGETWQYKTTSKA